MSHGLWQQSILGENFSSGYHFYVVPSHFENDWGQQQEREHSLGLSRISSRLRLKPISEPIVPLIRQSRELLLRILWRIVHFKHKKKTGYYMPWEGG